ncbi:MAG: hypothetical protein P8J37_11375 [Fuerstiella sp.]|nr:hypothetical protein [Fuerstiella sp.]
MSAQSRYTNEVQIPEICRMGQGSLIATGTSGATVPAAAGWKNKL